MGLTSTKKIENNKVELEITVGGEEFKEATQKAYEKMVVNMNVPGFRKGKAPRKMIEKMYGEGVFVEEAVNMLYPKAFEAAVVESEIQPVDRAQIEVTDANPEGFTFKATVTVKPEIELGDYKGIEVTKTVKTVYADDVNEELENMRKKNAREITVEDRAAKNEDKVVIDFEGFVDGVAFEGGKAEDYPLVLGSNQFIPGFEDQIVGHKTGEEFDVTVKFPEEYHAEDLKGKDATFKVTVKSIAVDELPKVDDEFAKDVSEFDTLKELKADIKKNMTEARDKEAMTAVEDEIITNVIDGIKGDIPEVMYTNKVEEMVKDFEYRLASQGMSVEVYSQYTGTTMEGLRKTFEPTATRQVKTRLALEKVVANEDIKASQEEIEKEYERLAKVYGAELEKVKAFIPEKDLTLDIAVGKAIDFLVENAKVKEVKLKKSDLADEKE